MRWKISRHGHDPRQIDLVALLALLIVIVAAFSYFGESPKLHGRLHRAEPERPMVKETR
jgi:hypothetical protein